MHIYTTVTYVSVFSNSKLKLLKVFLIKQTDGTSNT